MQRWFFDLTRCPRTKCFVVDRLVNGNGPCTYRKLSIILPNGLHLIGLLEMRQSIGNVSKIANKMQQIRVLMQPSHNFQCVENRFFFCFVFFSFFFDFFFSLFFNHEKSNARPLGLIDLKWHHATEIITFDGGVNYERETDSCSDHIL